MSWVLALDLGNGGPKVAAVDPDGSILAAAHRPVDVQIGLDGEATQDAVQWWTAVGECVREITSIVGGDARAVAIMRPGTGLPPAMLPHLLGRRTRVRLAAGTLLTLDVLA